MDTQRIECTFAIIGGGIAGVSCAEGISFLSPKEKIVLITATSLVKAVTNEIPFGKTLMQFDIAEKDPTLLEQEHSQLHVIHDCVERIDHLEKLLTTQNGLTIHYKVVCLCTGAKPKLITDNNKYVLGIRDTESVVEFSQKIKHCRRIAIIGNGGIATELVHEVDGVEMFWVIKDKHISATFVDPGAAEFFRDRVEKNETTDSSKQNEPTKRMRYTVSEIASGKYGPALGPDWHNKFNIKGSFDKSAKVHVEYECEVESISEEPIQPECVPEEWPIYLKLTNSKIIGCDLIVSATGVTPNIDIHGLEMLAKGSDGGLLVDWKLETSEPGIYAAGDVCSVGWELAKHWFQMRLWTQAHQMGRYAAKSMVSTFEGEDFYQDFCFELFTHVTKFFGYKVVLLGLYNGQKLNKNYEILLRVTKGQEYVKLVLENDRMQGAVLIGDTDLEEMCENLILNQLDLSIYGEELLNPDIDIEDYFD